ncbi:hypothetical protein [Ileibacterium valens]|uniref:hypothetical protein n=1 Tax=Ileibacterium valens TaxID=1862668 RepID=UPI002573F437|nr:hypothetical protein [Ileibacterium valens]
MSVQHGVIALLALVVAVETSLLIKITNQSGNRLAELEATTINKQRINQILNGLMKSELKRSHKREEKLFNQAIREVRNEINREFEKREKE